MQIAQLLQQSENELIEFKEAKNQFDDNKLGRYCSALANEANLHHKPFAFLVLGVSDDKKIVGTTYCSGKNGSNEIKKKLADGLSERFNIQDIKVEFIEEKRILLFKIPAAPKGIPIAWKGHYYAREGESLSALNIEKMERIRSQNQQRDWSSEIVENAEIDDLDPQAILIARQNFIVKNPKLREEVASWDDKTFLNKAKLTIKGKITNAAIILLGKEESEVLINPASPMITWILKNEQGSEMDYEHFSCPLLLNVEKVFNKIRNLKYRYIKNGNLFPEEVEQYDPYIIREALHNAIAHQDYELGGKITLVECQNSQLYFTNSGRFIPQSIEMVLSENAPENRYRNRFLANAMVNINMIDTIGSGIRKMFTIQKERFFPLPEYQLSDQKVQVCIVGKVLDIAYAQKLASSPNLSLEEIMLLDKVQKKLPISDKAAKHLKSKKLIEGRKPNYYISATIAQLSDDEATYIHHKGLNDKYYQKLIIEYLQQFKTAKRKDFERLLLDKLPTALDENQKYHKIKNLLQSLKNQGIICNENRIWQLSR
ncbi:putative DNA binding domain-containing protein [Avibacterium sp. 20-15]|uniref:RNA-binding domain-containing protein n=1 Tax=unclassified Avibacterium TaxID=2685287 RepID=UPI0020270C0C|nr:MULTISPECIES: RNA-binding domain-containing protein [unclassified Avibacterium]MCW9732769.1 putative DNA binding domain-containing protein [Avibacterium sp. 20-15]URL04911.1 putative DNA binding domain-containing protein [Avibacterium sp. 20-132]